MELWLPGEDVGEIYGRRGECSLVFARRRSSQRQWRVAVKFSVLRLKWRGQREGKQKSRLVYEGEGRLPRGLCCTVGYSAEDWGQRAVAAGGLRRESACDVDGEVTRRGSGEFRGLRLTARGPSWCRGARVPGEGEQAAKGRVGAVVAGAFSDTWRESSEA